MKKLYSAAEKHYHVSQWRSSGQSMKSYSVSAGLCYQTFYNWAKSPAGEQVFEPSSQGFLAVGLQEAPSGASPRVGLDLGNGLVLRVY